MGAAGNGSTSHLERRKRWYMHSRYMTALWTLNGIHRISMPVYIYSSTINYSE